MKTKLFIPLFFAPIFLLITCTKKSFYPDVYGYPQEVGEIMIKKCAVPGCHTTQSKSGAANFDLSTWEHMFQGSSNGSPVIAYSSTYSSLLYFVNTYPDLGITQQPTMPVNKAPLTRDEVLILKNWIEKGAHDCEGNIKFSDDPKRNKVYVANQGCDVVTVFDAETMLPMRYINIGASSAIESPHMLKVAPDEKHWYVINRTGQYFQKYRTSDDAFVAQVNIGPGGWNTFAITSDSKTAYCVDLNANGKVAVLNLDNMSLITQYSGSGLFKHPHGTYIAPGDSTIYICAERGNFIYKLSVDKNFNLLQVDEISFEAGVLPPGIDNFTPHEILFTPEGDKYFITCQKSNEVRVMDAKADTLITVIPTGEYASEMALSEKYGYLFVTCSEDVSIFHPLRGTVAVIDYKNNSFIKKIYTGHEPHGIAVNENTNQVIVANRNVLSGGPAPHHTGVCGGKNGYVTVIDMNTLELVKGKKIEVSIDPYSVAVKK